jgi:probable HAF family extracellular repeat protein
LPAIVILGVFGGSALAGKGGKGGGGSGGGATANVEYDVVWLGTLGGSESSALAVNSSGQVVGWSFDANGNQRATYFSPTGPIDLNSLMADLISARADGPWTAWIAADINDLGQITGSIRPSSGISHPFIYDPGDPASDRPRRLIILDQLHGATTRGWAINNLGDIAGDYFGDGGGSFVYSPGGVLIDMGPIYAEGINDAGQVVFWDEALGSSWRYTPDLALGDNGQFVPFPGGLWDINFYGDVAGVTHTQIRRNKYVDTIYRASDPASQQVIYEGSAASFPCINDEMDVCFVADGRLKLYTDKDGLGLIDVDPLVTGDNASLSKWGAGSTVPQEITNRDDSGFPIICGYGHFVGGVTEAFVLVPRLK